VKAIKTWLNSIAWLLSAPLLLQSCVVYHNTSATLDRASQDQIKTKVTNTNGEISKYKYITDMSMALIMASARIQVNGQISIKRTTNL
jgi:hypothetical protein